MKKAVLFGGLKMGNGQIDDDFQSSFIVYLNNNLHHHFSIISKL
jgi:hypothetical protein